MLEKIVCYLTELAVQSRYFEKVFPLARLVYGVANVGGRTVMQSKPAQYTSDGQMEDVSIFDHKNGVAYYRITGKPIISTPTRNQVPCAGELKFDYPIRLVGCVRKDQLSKDDLFSEERIARTLVSILTVRHSELTKSISGAREVTFVPNNIIYDGQVIANEEYRNYGITDINYNYAYIAIDFTASVTIKQDCIESECSFTLDSIPATGAEPCFFTSCQDLKDYIDSREGGTGITCDDLAACETIVGIASAIDEAQSDIDAHTANTSNPHAVTKTQVGLGNVDNTSDANKPVSTAQQAALDLKYDASNPSGFISTISGIAAGGDLSGTYPNPAVLNSAVLAKVLTGYTSGAGTISAADTVLQAIQKLNGNIAALTTANVPDSTNKRYVTDAQLTVIGNTSGTNTGDQSRTSLGVLFPVTYGHTSFTPTANQTFYFGTLGNAPTNTINRRYRHMPYARTLVGYAITITITGTLNTGTEDITVSAMITGGTTATVVLNSSVKTNANINTYTGVLNQAIAAGSNIEIRAVTPLTYSTNPTAVCFTVDLFFE